MSLQHVRRRGQERGFTLIVALLLMVALSLIGVSALKNVTLQERMAGNAYYRILAGQESDASLRLAKASVDRVRLDPALQMGLSSPYGWQTSVAEPSISYWAADANWSSAQNVTGLSAVGGLDTKWQVEAQPGRNPNCPSSKGDNATGGNACPAYFFRSTARTRDTVTGAASAAQDWSMFPAD
jgi:PilX N-terminal